MTGTISWILALKIHPGQLEPFKALAAKLIESTKSEPGTLNYKWTLNADGTLCHVYERYVDSAAILIHVERNGANVGQLLQIATPESFYLYGSPNDKVRQALADLKPVYMAPLGGFSRA
jgi:quinol monooxygenase YgiN